MTSITARIPIDIIIFDVDGTLVDSRYDIVNAVNYTLARLGVPKRGFEDIVSYIGTGVRDLIRKSLGGKHASLAETGVEIFSSYYIKHSAEKSVLYPHVRKVLEHFRRKKKLISTNRFSEFADATLRELGIRDYFEDIIGGDDENCMKPSACVLNKVFSRLKMDRSKTIIVGDMAIDIKTGRNSGIKTCWVTYGLGKREDVEPLKPDYVIDDMLELKDIII